MEPRGGSAVTDGGGLSEFEFQAVCRHLDDLVKRFEELPFPEVRDNVFELLQTVDTLHRSALERLVDVLRRHDGGGLLDRAAADPMVATLLVLYDLIPEPVAPPAPTAAPATVSFIPLDKIGRAPLRTVRKPVFTDLARLDDLPPGTMLGIDADGVRVLVANVAGEVFAVRDACPGGVVPLSLGAFTPPIVVCAWHNEAFDVRTGKRADGVDGPRLDVLPVSVQDGVIRLAVSTVTAGARLTAPRP